MPGTKKSPAAAAVAPVARPYTHRGGQRPPPERNGGEQTAVNSAEWEAIHALDRKLTDGLNLVHEQLGVIRQERLEDRREFREFRNEVRQEFKAVREETRAEFQAVREEIAAVYARIDRLEETIREFSAQVGTLLERTQGTRRLVWGVLGTLGLLVAGGMLRPVFDRMVAALFAG